MSDKRFDLTEDQFLFAQEEIIFNVTEDILLAMEKLDISKSELANRLNKSKSYVSQLLNGTRNMTLRTFSDICLSLGIDYKVSIFVDGKDVSIQKEREWHSSPIEHTSYMKGVFTEKELKLSSLQLKKNNFGYSNES